MKTIKEWLESIQDEKVRAEALENMDNPTGEAGTMSAALSSAFVWLDSPQGHKYWSEVADSFNAHEQSTNP